MTGAPFTPAPRLATLALTSTWTHTRTFTGGHRLCADAGRDRARTEAEGDLRRSGGRRQRRVRGVGRDLVGGTDAPSQEVNLQAAARVEILCKEIQRSIGSALTSRVGATQAQAQPTGWWRSKCKARLLRAWEIALWLGYGSVRGPSSGTGFVRRQCSTPSSFDRRVSR